MPCNASYTRFIFGRFFFSYALQFDMHFYMDSYVDKKFILVKSGCYIFTSFSTDIIMHRLERSNLSKRVFQFKIQLFVLVENLAKQLILVG
jgi:hypothetical protein